MQSSDIAGSANAGRIIGIRHRIKLSKDGEALPTQVVIRDGENVRVIELETETDELDFAWGRCPTGYRTLEPGEDISKVPQHHRKERKLKADEPIETFPQEMLRRDPDNKKVVYVTTKVPTDYDGLRKGDRVAMTLGGSGNCFAYALANRGQQIGASVYRIAPNKLKLGREARGVTKKDDDAGLLVTLLTEQFGDFYLVRERDKHLIRATELWRRRVDAMKNRMACEQRLRQRAIGIRFFDNLYKEGTIEDSFAGLKANDQIFMGIVADEKRCERELVKAIEQLDIFISLFADITGVGPMIAARLIVPIGDIRRFATPAKLKAFCGAHVLPDGRFPRRRNNEVANWSPEARQALFLLADQFNRRPDSEWGQKLIEYKKKLRLAHPEVEIVGGKKRYTDGHIHKMASWKTASKFVERLWRDWWRLEKDAVKIVSTDGDSNNATSSEVA